MAEAPPPPQTGPASAESGNPSLQIVSQYIKDLSFESPNAPQPQQLSGQPRFEVAVNVGARKQSEGVFAAEQTITVKAELESKVLFALELVYGGLFQIANVPEDRVYPLLMIDCQQLLFPFARQTISQTIQAGGFPPILLQPVDFVALFRKNHPPKQAEAAVNADAETPAGKPN